MESQSAKVIGFDMDGVIIDHTAVRIEVAKRLGLNLRPEDTPSDVLRVVLSDKDRYAIQNAIYNTPETALKADLMAGAIEGLKKLKDSGRAFYLISRRKDPKLAIGLLVKHGLWPKYFHNSNTYFVENGEEKDIQARQLKITDYADDELKILSALQSVKNKILFDPYKVHAEHAFLSVSGWPELSDLLLS